MRNIFDLSGKIAIVVGGGSGLGMGMSTGLAQAGATVIVAGRILLLSIQSTAFWKK